MYLSLRLKKTFVVDVICALLILLFMYAALSKLIDYEKFRVQLSQSPMLTLYASWVAIVVPAVEILLSLLLSINRLRLIALYGSFALMVMFSAYIIAITQFSEVVPCSCGGILQNMTWSQHLFFNIIFVLLTFTAILFHEPTYSNFNNRGSRKPAE